jgi:hypothetical protein
MRSDAKSYQSDQLPAIDYDKHAAYGRVLPMAMLGAKLKAMVYFSHGLILASSRRLIDVEHLPRPAEGEQKIASAVRLLPTYLRLILLQRLSRLSAGQSFKPKTTRGAELFEPLQRDGVAPIRLPADKLAELRNLLAPQIKTLEQKLAAKPATSPNADDTKLVLAPEAAADVYNSLNQIASDLGVLEAASAYLKRPVGVGEVAVQINDPVGGASDFADVGVDASPCNHFHVDQSFNILKAVIYLGDAGAANGPLTYVVGSQRAAKGFWDSLIRRANDFGGLSATTPSARELFFALPEGLRRKAAFGADLAADTDQAQSVLTNQWAITSDIGNAALYDPAGIYRDGIVSQGRRIAVAIKLTELAR